jgi:Coenzyme PQQ synthesis protein D (PqqD)
MTLTLRPGVSTADTDYGTTLLDETSGEYFTLNPTATLVLKTLLAGGTPEQAARALTDEYAVDAETAGQDVADLIGGLRSAHLVADR